MYILGISGHQRDAAAALLKDGQLIAAIEEEKLNRVKHIGINQCGGLPYQAIGFCLDSAGIGIEEIDYLTYYLKPRRLLNRQCGFYQGDHQASCVNEYHDRLNTLQLMKRLSDKHSKVLAVDHQLAHAASSFYLSGFDRAAILILGGKGDHITIAAGIGEGRRIRLLKRVEFPHSLGWLYSLVSEYLGYRANGGEHNTQWLSLSGEPEFLSAFQDLLRVDHEGNPNIDLSYFADSLAGPDPFSEKFYARFGDCLRRKDHRFNGGAKRPSWHELIEELSGRQKTAVPANNYRRNIAHSLQVHLERAVLDLVEHLRREYRVDALALAGGVASNSLLVSKLERASGFKHIFVQPAAGNAGCSIGAALFQWHHQLNKGNPQAMEHVFLGPEYSEHEIKPVLDNCKVAYRYIVSEEKLLDEVVELLHQGNIVAWFQGRAEFGSRSLGARSILASPLLVHTKENLNLFVKHREASRPFAASVPEDRAEEFFDDCSPLARFLLTVSHVKKDLRHLIPAAWFQDGMARVHTVNYKTNPLFWRLLNKFGDKTGVPILVNTSFNLFGEPIVCTPREAVRSFYCSGIDALVINRFIIRK
jgi:carbamoyltransferase